MMSSREDEQIDPAPSPAAERYDRAGPFIVGSAIFLQSLDATIVAGALPIIARSLGEPPLAVNAAITVYLFASAVFVPISGWMADRFGARRVFHAAILLFTFASVLCGASQTLWQLVAARVLQGAAASMITPVGRLVLLQRTPRAHLVQAISFLGIPIVLGPVLGPPLGGLVVTYFSWHWIFLLNVPIGVAAYLLSRNLLRDVPGLAPYPLDWRGFLLSSVGLAALIFGVGNLGLEHASPALTVGPMLLGAIALAGYLAHARASSRPILDLGLLRVPSFFSAILGGIALRVSVSAMPVLLALMLQLGFGLSPLDSGLITFTSAAAALLMKVTARQILRRLGFRRALIGNTVLVAASLTCCALFTVQTPLPVIAAVLFIGGFFRSLQFTALNTLTFADMDPSAMSRASSLSSMAQQLAETLSISLTATLLAITLARSGRQEIQVGDVTPLFVLLGLTALASLPLFLRLGHDSGAEVSGQR